MLYGRNTATGGIDSVNLYEHEAALNGPIFHTEVGRERWEEQARRNVGEEVSELNS